MQLSRHETDLYILPETTKERHNVQSFFETKKVGFEWSFSNIEGQSWYGKQFLDVPFGIDYVKNMKEKFNITNDRT